MSVRWQERRVEDDLLKRELLLRLLGEYYAVPGRSEPASDHFYRRIRRLLLRHPLFAFKYYLFTIDLSLGRVGAPGADGVQSTELEVEPTLAALVLTVARRRWPVARPPGIRVRSLCGRAAAASAVTLRRQGRSSYGRLVSLRRGCAVTLSALLAALQRRRPGWQARLLRAGQTLVAWLASLAVELRRWGRWSLRHVLIAGLACGSVLSALFAELRRQRPVVQARVRRVRQAARATCADLVAQISRQRLALQARLVRLRRAYESVRSDVAADVRQRQRLLLAQGVRVRELGGRTAVGSVVILRRLWLVLSARVARLCRTGGARLRGLQADCRGARLGWQARLFRAKRVLGASGRRLRVELRRRRDVWSGAGRLQQGALILFAHATGLASRAWALLRPPWGHRSDRAVAGVLAGVVLAGGAVAAVVRARTSEPSSKNSATVSAAPLPPHLIPNDWRPPRDVSTPAAVVHRPSAPKRVDKRTAKPKRRAQPTSARQTILVSQTVPTRSVPTAAATSKPAVVAHSNGPAPLPAPAGASAPSPLKAP